MEQAEFEALVGRLNKSAERSPGVYRMRVGTFALFGYVVYGSILLVALGMLAGMAALMILRPSFLVLKFGWKLAIPLLVFVYALITSLRVSVPAPQGLAVTREQVPALFRVIDDLRAKLRVKPLERVLINEEFNAGVVQVPRLGLFGTSNYLIVGLPLLLALSKEDMTAVLAHEFGHLSGNHSRFSGWVYRAVRSYVRVLETTGGNRPLEKFLGWYVPRLDALSFPLRRQNEYEADAASAEIVGRKRAGQALTNGHVRGGIQAEFWTAIKSHVRDTRHPPADLFIDWERRIREQPPRSAEEALQAALTEATGVGDTHPSLSDRLEALGVEPIIEACPETSAARALLGEQYDFMVQQAGYLWSSNVHEGWKAEHDRIAQARQRLAALEKARASSALSAEQAFELADLSEDVKPDDDALPLYRSVLDAAPKHIGARFAVARLLLARDDAEGVPLMKRLAKAPELELKMAASALLSGYYARRGNERAARASMKRARRAHDERVGRQQQREQLNASQDSFVPHGLDREAIAKLREDLELFPAVKEAYLVRKEVAQREPELYVLGVEVALKNRVIEDEGLVDRILRTLTLPGETWCLRLDQNTPFRKALRNVSDSRIYGVK